MSAGIPQCLGGMGDMFSHPSPRNIRICNCNFLNFPLDISLKKMIAKFHAFVMGR